MTTQVNSPFLAKKIRPQTQFTSEQNNYFNQLERVVEQIYRRTGGPSDLVGSSAEDFFSEGIVEPPDFDVEVNFIDLSDRMDELENAIVPTHEPSAGATILMGTGDTSVTTTGLESYVICTNTANGTVTLNSTPEDGEKVKIKRRDAQITVSGSVNIDGAASYVISNQYDGWEFVYNDAVGEWGRY